MTPLAANPTEIRGYMSIFEDTNPRALKELLGGDSLALDSVA